MLNIVSFFAYLFEELYPHVSLEFLLYHIRQARCEYYGQVLFLIISQSPMELSKESDYFVLCAYWYNACFGKGQVAIVYYSPILFCVYIDDLLWKGVSYYLGITFVRVLVYVMILSYMLKSF